VTAAVFRREGQVDQRPHRAVRAQHRVGRLEQRVTAGGEAVVEVGPEPGQHGQGFDADSVVQQTHPHGLDMINIASTTHMITPKPPGCLTSVHGPPAAQLGASPGTLKSKLRGAGKSRHDRCLSGRWGTGAGPAGKRAGSRRVSGRPLEFLSQGGDALYTGRWPGAVPAGGGPGRASGLSPACSVVVGVVVGCVFLPVVQGRVTAVTNRAGRTWPRGPAGGRASRPGAPHSPGCRGGSPVRTAVRPQVANGRVTSPPS
jgi:hypothetical protein